MTDVSAHVPPPSGGIARLAARWLWLAALVAVLCIVAADITVARLDLGAGDYVQIGAALATLLFASAAASLALDASQHASLLREHIAQAELLAIAAGHQAAASAASVEVARDAVHVAVEDLNARLRPDLSLHASQSSGVAGWALRITASENAISVGRVWAAVQADGRLLVEQMRFSHTEIYELNMAIDGRVRNIGVNLAIEGPGNRMWYRRASISFGGAEAGIVNFPGEASREIPDWDWIRPDSGTPVERYL